MASLAIGFIGLCLSTLASAQTATVAPAPMAAQASGVSQRLDPGFAGFGIEPYNLYSFTGGPETNKLSVNLLQNLVDYSGAAPHIRVGGNSADNMVYDPQYNNYDISVDPHANGQGNVPSNVFTFGPSYWEAIDRFPKALPITFGLNLAYDFSDYIQTIVNSASACVEGLKNTQLYSFEIGNEPDLYLENAFRNGTWNGQVYTEQWVDRASAVWSQVLQQHGLPSNFFEPAATASTMGTTFTIDNLEQYHVNVQANDSSKSLVSSWNQHDYFYFVGITGFPLTLAYLMDFDNTETQFKYWTTEVQAAQQSGYYYNLREMATVGPVGLQGISDTFGAALWTLNFFLYAACLNITSVGMHMTDNSFASAWQPIPMYNQQPHARPSYYAWPAIDQLIGTSNNTLQVAPLPLQNLPAGYPGFVRAYAQYSNGSLTSVTLINGKSVNATESPKNSLILTLTLPPSAAGQTLYLSWLNAAGADATSNTTWNNLSFEANGDGTASNASDGNPATVHIGSDGSASITLRDSQAVIANIGLQLGSTPVRPVGGAQPRSAATPTGSFSPLTVSTALAATSVVAGPSTTGKAHASKANALAAPRSHHKALAFPAAVVATVTLGMLMFALA